MKMWITRMNFTLTDDEMAEIAKLDGTKKYYNASKEEVAKYAKMHLPFEENVISK